MQLGPSTAAVVFQSLQQALKADQHTRQHAEAQLAAWGSQPGYCSCLLVRPPDWAGAPVASYRLAHRRQCLTQLPACAAVARRRVLLLLLLLRARQGSLRGGRLRPLTARVQAIVQSREDYSARWLALSQLKHCVVKHWRPSSSRRCAHAARRPNLGALCQALQPSGTRTLCDCRAQGLAPEEKAHVRSSLLSVVAQEDSKVLLGQRAQCVVCPALLTAACEPRPMLTRPTAAAAVQFANQVAVVFAKVARVDFPRDWPSLFQDLLGKLQDVDTLLARRTFLVLHHILKELATKRLASDQRSFAEVPACAGR